VLEEKLERLQELFEERQRMLLEVNQMIDELPTKDQLKLEDEFTLGDARLLVEKAIEAGVPSEEIVSLSKLIALEERLAELKEEKVVQFVQLNDLPNNTDIELSDLNGHWARKDINTMTQKELIFGYPNATFKPNQPITRAEVMVIVSRLLTPFPEGTNEWTFNDQSPPWAEDAILGGVSLGLISGYPSNRFGANDQITRAELAVILNNVVQLVDEDKHKWRNTALVFEDAIPAWSQEAITNMTELRILSGYHDQTFRPHAHATRAEVASVMYRLLQ
jgi:hypothetical protein